MGKEIPLEKKLLSENDRLADLIRQKLSENRIVALNLVSSPGSGKTSLLESTIRALGKRRRLAVIAGDVQTENDAQRLRAAGGNMVQAITTGGACHLDANMVTKALSNLDLSSIELLFIENVGNLVCPASFDLGEDMKVVLMSTTEGDDKPLKYPAMFRRASALVINKIDLLGFSNFDLERAKIHALRINGELTTFEVSCQTGAGLDKWYAWLENLIEAKRSAR